MATAPRVGETLTLEEFLRLPGIDEGPYLEYVDGRIEAKMSPQKKHGLLEKGLMNHIDAFAEPRGLGVAFPELRCTFAGRSIVADVAFLLDEHIETDDEGEVLDPTPHPPDIHIEVVSPDQPARRCRERIVFSTSNGCALGWLIDPIRKTVEVFRAGQLVGRMHSDGILDGEPVLAGYRLPVADLFGWLKVRKPNRRPRDPGSDAEGDLAP